MTSKPVGGSGIDPELTLSRLPQAKKGKWSATNELGGAVMRAVAYAKPSRESAVKTGKSAPSQAIEQKTAVTGEKRPSYFRQLKSGFAEVGIPATSGEITRLFTKRVEPQPGVDYRHRFGASMVVAFHDVLGEKGVELWKSHIHGAIKGTVKEGKLQFEEAKETDDPSELHPAQLKKDFPRQVTGVNDELFIPNENMTPDENNLAIPAIGIAIHDALQTAFKGRADFEEHALQGLRYELEGLLVQTFLSPVPAGADPSHPANQFVDSYQRWELQGHQIEVLQLTPKSSLAEQGVKEAVKEKFGLPLRYELHIGKDQITVTITNYLHHVDTTDLKLVGYDVQEVKIGIDPKKLHPKDLLLSPEAVTVTYTYHGLQPPEKAKGDEMARGMRTLNKLG